jgi:hypothetical protein
MEIPETVLLETSYDEEFGSKQTEVSKLPFSLSLVPQEGMISAPPLLDELNSDSDSSFDSSFSLDVCSKIHHSSQEDNVEVCVDDGDSFYTGIMNSQKHVRFGTVEIRHYPLILGNHPNCQETGLPLELDWNYTQVTTIDLSTNTTHHQEEPPKKPRRLTLLQRMKRLKAFYNTQELWLAERHRRRAFEEEEIQLYFQNTRSKDTIVCVECEWDEQDADYFDDVDLISRDERQVMKHTPNLVCDAIQCLVSE